MLAIQELLCALLALLGVCWVGVTKQEILLVSVPRALCAVSDAPLTLGSGEVALFVEDVSRRPDRIAREERGEEGRQGLRTLTRRLRHRWQSLLGLPVFGMICG